MNAWLDSARYEVPLDRPGWSGNWKTLIPSGIEQPFCNRFD